MLHIPGVVEKKLGESVWDSIRKFFTRYREQQKRIEALEAALAEERGGKLAFERLMAEMVYSKDDDGMYWKKDGSGPFCPVCVHKDHIDVPLSHGATEGTYSCSIHSTDYWTREYRERRRSNHIPRPRSWHAIRQRLEAESYRQAQRNR